MRTHTFDDKVRFIFKLGAALHRYGVPSHRLEEALGNAASKLGLESQFLSTPTSITATLLGDGRETTRIVRVAPGVMDLGKLSLVDQLGDQAILGTYSLQECSDRIDTIVAKPPYYSWPLTLLCHGLSSLGIACIFLANVSDLLWSFVVGTLIGMLQFLANRSERLQRVFEAAAAFTAAIVASLVQVVDPTVSVPTVVAAGIVGLLPGLTLTIAMNELATQHLIAGTARLTGSLMTLLKLVIGVALGTTLTSMFFVSPSHVPGRVLPSLFVWVGLVLASLSLIVLYKTHSRDRIWVFLAACLGFGVTKLGTIYLGPILGVFTGGFVIGAGSNLFARILQRPASIIVVPGIVLLVPGSLGYRGLSFMMQNEVIQGVDNAFHMLLVAITIVAGILFGNVFILPRRSL